jgi:hypothetical protein
MAKQSKKTGKKSTSWRTSAAAMDFNFGQNAKPKGGKGSKGGRGKPAGGGSV